MAKINKRKDKNNKNFEFVLPHMIMKDEPEDMSKGAAPLVVYFMAESTITNRLGVAEP